jgi:hypothetical protein
MFSAPAVAGERVLDLGALHEQSSSAVGAGTHLRGSLQATLNLSLLSLFPTPADRAKALVPQQVMTISGLLLGMTLPAILRYADCLGSFSF